jgi:hypothetical protein
MKNSRSYSKEFANMIQLSGGLTQLLLSKCSQVETIQMFKHESNDDKSDLDNGTVSMIIYGTPSELYSGSRYSFGYVLYDDWTGHIWYCDKMIEALQIVEDYHLWIQDYMAEEHPYIALTEDLYQKENPNKNLKHAA